METHELLQKYLAKKKATQPGFSLRSLAKRLEISPAFLSRMLSGKKPVPYETLVRLLPALDVEPELRAELKRNHLRHVEGGLTPKRGKTKVSDPVEGWERVDGKKLSVLQQWFYLALLELSTLPGFSGAATASARLGIPLATAEIALQELEAMGLLVRKGNRLEKSRRKTRWASAHSLAEIRRFHGQMLEKAGRELKDASLPEDFERRMIAGITVTANPATVEAAKAKINRCLHEIADDLMSGEGTDVYHLALQLFPLTKR